MLIQLCKDVSMSLWRKLCLLQLHTTVLMNLSCIMLVKETTYKTAHTVHGFHSYKKQKQAKLINGMQNQESGFSCKGESCNNHRNGHKAGRLLMYTYSLCWLHGCVQFVKFIKLYVCVCVPSEVSIRGGGEVTQTMYTHVSKCKNDKIKIT
jgi:hypothetical protein